MIDLKHDGIQMQMTLEQVEPFIRGLDREALIRLVLQLADHVRHISDQLEKSKPQDSI